MSNVADQYADALPPRKGAVLALGIDTTPRAYDLTGLLLGGMVPDSANTRDACVNIQLTAQGGDVFLVFAGDNTVTMTTSAAIAAGGALAFANTYCQWIPAGSTAPARIHRNIDKFLHVATSTGTATLRINAFSASIG